MYGVSRKRKSAVPFRKIPDRLMGFSEGFIVDATESHYKLVEACTNALHLFREQGFDNDCGIIIQLREALS